MSEMVERVAAVIAAEIMELTAEQRASFRFPHDANGDTCDRARSAAGAVIEAMREPTSSMLKIGRDSLVMAIDQDNGCLDDGAELEAWQAMIDEAMK